MRVLLADDHPLFLDGLKNLLAGRGVPGGFGLVLGTILVEKVLDGLALLAIAGALALRMALPGWFGTAAWSFAATLGLLAAGTRIFRISRLERESEGNRARSSRALSIRACSVCEGRQISVGSE